MQAVDIDTLLEDERVTYIKMDVEGAEMEALKGGKEQIKRNKPKLFIARCGYFPAAIVYVAVSA